MAVYKCKMCGGSLEPAQSETVCRCRYCGTVQTLPQTDNERLRQHFDRANSFRLNNDFDSAAMVYENIITEYPEEAEAHWGMCLCRYGIEYVKDPRTGKRLATCHRTQYRSILEDPDFAMAVRYADGAAESVYREEAAYINAIQQKLLDISRKEEPFDIFICYKETDSIGNRTTDSVIAQDIYEALDDKGYRVFFSRITLEDKLGQEYEPYIFAALNSAKIMLVVGTKPDNFNSVWVKNEWARYLALAEKGDDKDIIPCYRDMSPYDLPPELQALQSQDVSKVGYMQDLLRGIEKILGSDAPAAAGAAAFSAESLAERAKIFLEDGNFDQAEIYCEKALDADPRNAEAYLGKLLAELKLTDENQLMDVRKPIGRNDNYEKAYRFADDALKKRLCTYEMNSRYLYAVSLMEGNASQSNLVKAISIFETLGAYSGAAEGKSKAERQLREIGENDYLEAKALVENSTDGRDYIKAKKILEEAGADPRSADLIAICNEKLEEKYQKAYELLRHAHSADDFSYVQKLFEEINGYKDSGRHAFTCAMKFDETSEYEQEHLEEERRRNEAVLMEKELLVRAAENQMREKKKTSMVIFFSLIAAVSAALTFKNADSAMKYNFVLFGSERPMIVIFSCILVASLIMIEWAAKGSVKISRWQMQKLAIAVVTIMTTYLVFNTTDSIIHAAIVLALHCAAILLAVVSGKLYYRKINKKSN